MTPKDQQKGTLLDKPAYIKKFLFLAQKEYKAEVCTQSIRAQPKEKDEEGLKKSWTV